MMKPLKQFARDIVHNSAKQNIQENQKHLKLCPIPFLWVQQTIFKVAT